MGVRSWIANNVAVRGGINEVTVTDTPASGEVLTATSSSTASWQPGGGGGGGAVDSVDGQTGDVDLSDVYAPIVGTPIVRAFPFAYNSANILTGHAVYTPTVGDILLDAWVEIGTGWDGTTPLGDVGAFINDVHYGWFYGAHASIPMDQADLDGGYASEGLLTSGFQANPSSLLMAAVQDGGNYQRRVPGKLISAAPIKVCVSQNGLITGADPGSTQGAAVLYLVTVTPA